ncbi:MAG: hypothetical protein EXS10_02850 [Phycisphaerales bacterium]|nr:hypothetical protein [Phycisphaerales bacterium]
MAVTNADGSQEPRPLEVEEAPRRAASAVLGSGTNASADGDMRDALDPANQSLGEALKLSYRILQLGVLALVVTFLFSGFQQVEEGFTGVKTLFGRIEGEGMDRQLEPGLHATWPYPVGDVVSVEARRTVRLDHEFWPVVKPNLRTIEEQIESATLTDPLRPGADGSLLTRDGDLAHAKIEASYVVDDVVELLEVADRARMDDIVKHVLMQATVEAAGALTLAELVDAQRDFLAEPVRTHANALLQGMHLGVSIVEAKASERSYPFAVRNRFLEAQTMRENVKAGVERARQQAATQLTSIAGEKAYADLVRLVAEYDSALTAQDGAKADATLLAIGARFEATDIGGEAAMIINRAKASQGALEGKLTRELRRLQGLAPAFAENPRQVVRQLWLAAVRDVLSQPYAEVFSVPPSLADFSLHITSSEKLMQQRRDAQLESDKQAAEMQGFGNGQFNPSGRQIMIDQAGRRLERDASKGFSR